MSHTHPSGVTDEDSHRDFAITSGGERKETPKRAHIGGYSDARAIERQNEAGRVTEYKKRRGLKSA